MPIPKIPPSVLKLIVEDSAAKDAFKKKFTTGFYHGSPSNKIKAFDSLKKKDSDFAVPGVTFVTRDPDFAESFLPTKGGSTQKMGADAFVNNENRYGVPNYKTGATMYPVSVNLGKHFDPTAEEAHDVIMRYTGGKDNLTARDIREGSWTAIEHPNFLNHLRNEGFDTFTAVEGGIPNVGIFEPHNIRGKFAKYNPEDAMNPDFMKAEGGSIGHYEGGGKVGALAGLAQRLGKPTLELLQKSPEELLAARQAMTGFVQKQNPILAQATDAYRLGKISHDEFQDIVGKTYKPHIIGAVPERLSPYDIAVTVGPGKAKKGIVDYNVEIPKNAVYDTRLDIPGNEATGRNVGSILLPSGKTVYGQAEHLGKVGFESDPTKSMRVALGTKEQAMTPGATEHGMAKSPFAVVRGTHLGTDPEEIRRMMEFYTGAPEWKEIGMNPYAHSQFFHKQSMQPAWNSDEVLKYGNYVLAKHPELTHWADPRLAVDVEKIGGVPNLKFSAGGEVLKKAAKFGKSVPFVHFSQSPVVSRLEPTMYGTGIKGAEAARLKSAPDIENRSYFYTARDDVRPEQGLGKHKYEGIAEGSYPLHEDPENFYAAARQSAIDPYFAKMGREIVDKPTMLNNLERAIKEAGYGGYHTSDAGIVWHPTDVKKAKE